MPLSTPVTALCVVASIRSNYPNAAGNYTD